MYFQSEVKREEENLSREVVFEHKLASASAFILLREEGIPSCSVLLKEG
jgi:hypothetical protein